MNCLEFRRLCLSEPGSRDAGYLAHREECDDCARYADSVVATDRKLEHAMRVPVPDDLANRIRLRQVIQDEQITRRFRPMQLALAASVLLVVGAAAMFGYQFHTTNQYVSQLAASAVDHTRMERQGGHFVAEHQNPVRQRERFKQVLASFGAKVMDDELDALGDILHVQVCALDSIEGPVAHVVIQGDMGEVTVYYAFGDKLRKSEDFDQGQFKGMLVPAGQGNLAIVGDPGEQLVAVADKLEHAIAWHI
jgi:hypothetical protein